MSTWGVPTPAAGQPIIDTRLEEILARLRTDTTALHALLGTIEDASIARNDDLRHHLIALVPVLDTIISSITLGTSTILARIDTQTALNRRLASAVADAIRADLRLATTDLRDNLWWHLWRSFGLAVARLYHRVGGLLWQ